MRRRLMGLAILALALELTGCSTAGTGDAITRAIESREDSNGTLMPRTFAPSLTGTEVGRRLVAAGYKPDLSPVPWRFRKPIPADGLLYSKWVTRFPCINAYEVVVRVDSNDRLIDVYSAQWQPACT